MQDGHISLTEKGEQSLQPYKPKRLVSSHILVIFDIPEREGHKRRTFRTLLRELRFRQVQKSVWMSDYECQEILAAEVGHLQIRDYVEVFEATELPMAQ